MWAYGFALFISSIPFKLSESFVEHIWEIYVNVNLLRVITIIIAYWFTLGDYILASIHLEQFPKLLKELCASTFKPFHIIREHDSNKDVLDLLII